MSNTDFPGKYCFDIGYEEEKVPVTKSVHWTYSPYLDKLFLKMRVIVPFRIKLQGEFLLLLLSFFIDVIIIVNIVMIMLLRYKENSTELLNQSCLAILKFEKLTYVLYILPRCNNNYKACQ